MTLTELTDIKRVIFYNLWIYCAREIRLWYPKIAYLSVVWKQVIFICTDLAALQRVRQMISAFTTFFPGLGYARGTTLASVMNAMHAIFWKLVARRRRTGSFESNGQEDHGPLANSRIKAAFKSVCMDFNIFYVTWWIIAPTSWKLPLKSRS